MADKPPHANKVVRNRVSKPNPKKLPRLPPNAQVEKRPLLRPAISSPYAGAQQQKTVYISVKTPFLSAVKRVEKLLHLSDKRLVQSATTLAKQNKRRASGKRKRGAGDDDEILDIAETVEKQKRLRKSGKGAEGAEGDEGLEEVVLKGTGKAIQKVMELGLWFQQRDEYVVRLKTSSVAAIDDISVDESSPVEAKQQSGGLNNDSSEMELDTEPGAEGDGGGVAIDPAETAEGQDGDNGASEKSRSKPTSAAGMATTEPTPDTRLRYTSCLEVAVSLR